MSTQTLPAGPKGRPLSGLLPAFRRDPLALLTEAAHQHGPIARIALGPVTFYLLSDPAYIEQVLVTQNRIFMKGKVLEAARRVLGNGLLTSEGDFWRRQRRLAQPAFHRGRIIQYGESMVAFAQRQMGSWQAGDVRDLSHEMMRLTLAIAAKTLFSADVETDADRVGEALEISLTQFNRRTRSLIKIPESWPTPGNRKAERAAQVLDRVIYQIIDERRASGEDTGDLLSMLLQAQDEDGTQMTPKQLRDEVMTIFLAGHETTANAMAWTWYLLSQNPSVEATLHAELDQVLGGRPPTVDDLPLLPFAEAVITESMRLFPPAWILTRRSTAPITLGEYTFPADTNFMLSQWVMHRHPKYYEEPTTFRPERWLEGLAGRLPAFAYFPFGGGPRLCIGKGFAQMEAVLLLATIAQAFRFRLVTGHPIETQPLITLRPKHGIKVTLQRRGS